MKLLLVNPSPIQPFTVDGPSLGLCYLSSYLKARGIGPIEGIDLNVDPLSNLEPAIARADLVGVYCSTKALSSARMVARKAREAGKTVVMGGPHPSVLPEEVLGDPNVDFVVLSEGEETFYELLTAIAGGPGFAEIDGLGYKEDGELKINPKTRFIKDLDTVPFPDRELFRFDYSKYVTFCATRGCPYKCANCQPALSMQTCKFRIRSVGNVIEELRRVGRSKSVHFVDNDLTVNRRWLTVFCEALISENMGIVWDCQGRVNTLDRELLALMKRAGCQIIGLGIESGSQEMLDGFLRKQIKLTRAKEVIRESIEVGIRLHGWFIIGIPSETKEDIERTIEFALTNDFANVGFSIGTPWPGTLFQKISKENGWIVSDEWDDFNEKLHSKLRTPEWGPEDIDRFRERTILAFRKKGWVVNENDFMFGDPCWGLSRPMRAIKRPLIAIYLGLRQRGLF